MDFTKSNIDPQMAFIVGMGRSGTTMLTNMLNSNKEVISTPENEFLLFGYSGFKNRKFEKEDSIDEFLNVFEYDFNKVLSVWKPGPGVKQAILNLKEKNYAAVCKEIYLHYPFAGKKPEEVKCIVDKNPIYTLFMDKLHRVYPQAKYILIVRDFRDNVLSRKKHSTAGTSVYDLAVTSNYFYDEAFQYIETYKLKYETVRYEDLVSDPEKVLKRVCLFLGIEYSPEMMHFQKVSRQMKEHVKETASEKVYKKISGMHSNLDKELNTDRVNAFAAELTPKEIGIINYICKKYIVKFGYDLKETDTVPEISRLKVITSKMSISFYYGLKRIYYTIPVRLRRMTLRSSK